MARDWVRGCFSGVMLLGLAGGGAGCQRSPAYRQDVSSLRDENPSYYSAKGADSRAPTDRVASMGQPRKRVAIFDFWNETPVREGTLGTFAADELRRILFLSGRVIVPTDQKTQPSTEDFTQGEKVRVAQLIREGRKLGVAVVVIGRVARVVFRTRGDDVGVLRQKQSLAAVDVEAKIFDVSSGRELAAVGRGGEAASNALLLTEGDEGEMQAQRAELVRLALRNAAEPLAVDVLRSVEKLTWEGRIARILGGKIYLNAGRSSGLVSGDILRVQTQGEDIYDPATGAFLGRTPGQLKGTLEVRDFIGPDGAMAEVHTGANFQEGDLVKLY
jgi:hypothetical protein